MNKESIIREGYKQLEAANHDALITFIANDATIRCDIYGDLKLAQFFKLFLNDTSLLTTTIKKISKESSNSNFITAQVRFIWTLKNEQVISGDATIFFCFNHKNKINYIRSTYNFVELS
jgi:hypothetical protein